MTQFTWLCLFDCYVTIEFYDNFPLYMYKAIKVTVIKSSRK